MNEQQENLNRVRLKIEGAITSFASARLLANNVTFHMEDLLLHVREQVPFIAPDSPSRILRLLRQDGVIDYMVISRKNSLYRLYRVRDLIDQPICRGATRRTRDLVELRRQRLDTVMRERRRHGRETRHQDRRRAWWAARCAELS